MEEQTCAKCGWSGMVEKCLKCGEPMKQPEAEAPQEVAPPTPQKVAPRKLFGRK